MYSDPEPLPQSPEPDPVPLLPSEQGPTFEWPPGTTEIVMAHWESLYRLALAEVNDADAAADIVQNTLIRYLLGPAGFEVRTLYRPLLRWEILRWYKKQKKHRAVSLDSVVEELEHMIASDPDALTMLIESDEFRRATADLDLLKPEDKELIIRRYFNGEPSKSIADDLGVPDGTVRIRLYRAMQQLRARRKKS